MKTLIKGILFLSIAIIVACEDNDEIITLNESNKLIGFWINPIANDSELKFERASSLKKNGYGVAFFKENGCIERTSGWCGTPPIIYSDLQGSWSENNQIITVSFDNDINSFYNFEWQIKSISEKYLIVERLEDTN